MIASSFVADIEENLRYLEKKNTLKQNKNIKKIEIESMNKLINVLQFHSEAKQFRNYTEFD